MNLVAKTKPGKKQQKKSDDARARRRSNSRKAGNANTGPMFYFSNQAVKRHCRKEADAIKKHCGDDKEKTKQAAKSAPKNQYGNLAGLTDKVRDALDTVQDGVKKAYNFDPNKPETQWMGEHCDGLWMTPVSSGEFSQFTEKLQGIENQLKQELKTLLESTGTKVIELAKDTAISYGQKVGARTGVAAASLVIPVAGEVIMVGTTIWNVVDGVWTAGKTVMAALKIKDEVMAKYKLLEPKLEKIKALLSKDDSSVTASSIVAEMMTETAKHNPCVMARKCSLVPFEETKTAKGQAKTGNGCCPGQTGHHVLPGAMFDLDKSPCGRTYNHNTAPTICVEGANNNVGSHGAAHNALEDSIDEFKESGKTTISYKEASKRGIDAVREANPNCSAKCLQAQLDKHYKENLKCNEDSQLKPNPGKAEPKASKPKGTQTAQPQPFGNR